MNTDHTLLNLSPLGVNDGVSGLLQTVTPYLALAALALSLFSVGVIYSALPVKFGVVDLQTILQSKEKQFADLVGKKDVTDTDREAAYALMQSLGPSIEQAILKTKADCKCTLFVKGALLAPDDKQVIDYTAAVSALVLKP
jgi:hypothetical protein